MKKATKRRGLIIASALVSFTVGFGVKEVLGNARIEIEANASEISSEATNKQAEAFQMKSGASVRLNVEDGLYGIRFGAEVVDRTLEYGMLIVPTVITSGYETERESGETLSEYCERKVESYGGEIAKAEGLRADKDGEISMSLVEVEWSNLNREFEGIAYYETNGERVDAKRAVEGYRSRSVRIVAEQALESGELTEGEQEAVERLKNDGEKQSAGIAIDEGIDTQFLSVESESIGEVSIDAGTNEQEPGWHINGGTTIGLKIEKQTLLKRLKKSGGVVSFTLKGKYDGKAEFYDEAGEKKREEQLLSKEGKLIRMPREEFITYSKVVLRSAGDGTGNAGYYFSEVKEESALEASTRVEEYISSIPEKWTSGEETSVRGMIEKAEKQYLELSEKAQGFVKNYAKIATIKEKLQAGGKKQETLVSPSEDSGFFTGGSNTAGEGVKVRSKTLTGEHSEAWEITREAEEEAAYPKTEIDFSYLSSDIETITAGYDTIKIYVYAEYTSENGEKEKIAFSEAKHKANPSAGSFQKEFTIENGGWTKIELTSEEFLRSRKITALFDVQGGNKWRISAIYGVKNAA